MRKDLKNRKNIYGGRVTRRIKWIGGKDMRSETGERMSLCFIFCSINVNGLRIERVTGQLGTDMRDRFILPDFQQIHPDPNRVAVYAIASKYGELESTAESFIADINSCIKGETSWTPPPSKGPTLAQLAS